MKSIKYMQSNHLWSINIIQKEYLYGSKNMNDAMLCKEKSRYFSSFSSYWLARNMTFTTFNWRSAVSWSRKAQALLVDLWTQTLLYCLQSLVLPWIDRSVVSVKRAVVCEVYLIVQDTWGTLPHCPHLSQILYDIMKVYQSQVTA